MFVRPSSAWMDYSWLLIAFEGRDKLVVGGHSLAVFEADLVVFEAKILRSRWVGGFQIWSRGFLVTNFERFQVGVLQMDIIGQLGVIRLFPMFSNPISRFSALKF